MDFDRASHGRRGPGDRPSGGAPSPGCRLAYNVGRYRDDHTGEEAGMSDIYSQYGWGEYTDGGEVLHTPLSPLLVRFEQWLDDNGYERAADVSPGDGDDEVSCGAADNAD